MSTLVRTHAFNQLFNTLAEIFDTRQFYDYYHYLHSKQQNPILRSPLRTLNTSLPSLYHPTNFFPHKSLILPTKRRKLISLTPSSPTTTTLQITLLKAFIPTPLSTSNTPLQAHLEVGRKDFWKDLTEGGHARELAVMEAFVVGDVNLTGVRYVVCLCV